MARSVTLQSIADRARVHADMRNTGYINDTEMLAILNEVYPELYDELVSTSENYYATSTTFSVSSSAQAYPLPADFYKLLGVDFASSGNEYVTLFPYNEADRNKSPTASNIPSGTIRIRYVPAPTVFTSLSQSVDGIAGWDRLLSLLAAMDMLDSEESDSSALARKYARTLDRIRDLSAPRDLGMPATVTDVYQTGPQSMYQGLQYRLYGNNIEFINTETFGSALWPPFY